jgi:hypothetical protein
MIFDDVLGMAVRCEETFRSGVHDAFGASVVADVLDPIRKEIGLLRSFNEEFQHQSVNIDQVLQEAWACHLNDGSS